MDNAIADDGFFFGLGAFETIAVENGRAVFFNRHMQRLRRTLDFLGIKRCAHDIEASAHATLAAHPDADRAALKVTVTEHNIITGIRPNPYRNEHYARGFRTTISTVRRNETSPFAAHKTLNCGDNIFEKRRAQAHGVDEPIFLNMSGCIAEGACSNVFFARDGRLYTPDPACGLLDGIMRSFVCAHADVIERPIAADEASSFDEMFLTNSLFGIMPVQSLDDVQFSSRTWSHRLMETYNSYLNRYFYSE